MGFLIDNLFKKSHNFFPKKGQDVISHKLVFHKKSHDVNGFLKQDMYLLPYSFFFKKKSRCRSFKTIFSLKMTVIEANSLASF